MHTAQAALATRLHPTRLSAIGAGLALCLAMMTLLSVPQFSRMLAVFAAEAPVSVSVAGGQLDAPAGLLPGDRIALAPLAIEARSGDMRYALHVDLRGPAALTRQLSATVRAADGTLLYDGPLAQLSVGTSAVGNPERSLAAGRSERLMVTITVSRDAGIEIAGAALAVNWRADAVAELAVQG